MEDTPSKPTLANVATALGVHERFILNAYIGGSRLFQVATNDSDWDLVVVLSEFIGPLSHHSAITTSFSDVDVRFLVNLPDGGWHETFVETETLDISVYHYKHWAQLLRSGNVRLATFQEAPSEFKLKEEFRVDYKVHYMPPKLDIYKYSSSREKKSATMWYKGKNRKSRKLLVHNIRATMFAKQILEHGKVVDITAANAYYYKLMECEVANWSELFKVYKEDFNVLLKEFVAIANSYKNFEPTHTAPLGVIEFLASRNNSLDALECQLAIRGTRIYSELPGCELYELHSSVESPPREKVVLESGGTVLQRVEGNGHWELVSFPLLGFHNHNEDQYSEPQNKFVGHIDWDTTRIYAKPVGISVNLFYFQRVGKWLMNTHCGSSVYGRQYVRRSANKSDDVFTKDYKAHNHLMTGLIKDEFWNLWGELCHGMPSSGETNFVFNFVVNFDARFIQLVGIRDMTTLSELHRERVVSIASMHQWAVVEELSDKIFKTVQFLPSSSPKSQETNMAELVKYITYNFELSNPLEYEGVVACDASFTRLKFKSRAYELLSTKLDPFDVWPYNYDKFMHIALCLPEDMSITLPRFKAIYPEWSPWLEFVVSNLKQVCDGIDAVLANYNLLNIPPEEYIAICNTIIQEWSRVLFPLIKKGFKTAWSYFAHPDSMKTHPFIVHIRWFLKGGLWKEKLRKPAAK